MPSGRNSLHPGVPVGIVLSLGVDGFQQLNGVPEKVPIHFIVIPMHSMISQNRQIAVSPAQLDGQQIIPLVLRDGFDGLNTSGEFIRIIPLLNLLQQLCFLLSDSSFHHLSRIIPAYPHRWDLFSSVPSTVTTWPQNISSSSYQAVKCPPGETENSVRRIRWANSSSVMGAFSGALSIWSLSASHSLARAVSFWAATARRDLSQTFLICHQFLHHIGDTVPGRFLYNLHIQRNPDFFSHPLAGPIECAHLTIQREFQHFILPKNRLCVLRPDLLQCRTGYTFLQYLHDIPLRFAEGITLPAAGLDPIDIALCKPIGIVAGFPIPYPSAGSEVTYGRRAPVRSGHPPWRGHGYALSRKYPEKSCLRWCRSGSVPAFPHLPRHTGQ